MLIYYFLYFLVIIFGIQFKAYKGYLSVEKRVYIDKTGYYKQTFTINYLFIIGLLLVLIMGLRSSTVGIDNSQYKYLYENSLYFYETKYNKTELGFYFTSYFLHDILNLNYQVFLFLVACICVYSIFKCIKIFSQDYLVSIIIYISLGLFTMNLSGLRQTIAISLIMLSIPKAYEKKLIHFLILVIIAYSFHNSAVLFVPVFFIVNIRLNRKTAISVTIVAVMSIFYRQLLIPLFQYFSPDRYGKYIEYVHNSHVNPLVIAVPIVFIIFELIFVKEEADGKYSNVNSFAFVFSALEIIMRILSQNEPSIARLGYYFYLGNYILVPQALLGIEKGNNKKTRLIIESIVILLCCLYFIISTPGDTLQIDDYKFYWQS